MNGIHKIAVLRQDVYILYVAEMARNSGFLLFLETIRSRKFFRILNLIFTFEATKSHRRGEAILVSTPSFLIREDCQSTS
jgi:hypothetical protein